MPTSLNCLHICLYITMFSNCICSSIICTEVSCGYFLQFYIGWNWYHLMYVNNFFSFQVCPPNVKILHPSLGSTLDLITYKLNISLYICSAQITLSKHPYPWSLFLPILFEINLDINVPICCNWSRRRESIAGLKRKGKRNIRGQWNESIILQS